jgi:hypothetical protein
MCVGSTCPFRIYGTEAILTIREPRYPMKKLSAAVLALSCLLATAEQTPAANEPAWESDNWTEFREGNGSVFRKHEGGKWTCTQKDGTVFRFTEVERRPGIIDLYDNDRQMSVRLTKDKGLWQTFRQWPGSEGAWDQAEEVFREGNGSVFRKHEGGKWTCTQKDGTVFHFTEYRKGGGGVVLYDRDRDIFVMLGKTVGLWDRPLRQWPGSDGSWSK